MKKREVSGYEFSRSAWQKALKKAGITQGNAALFAGMTANSLSRKVRGKRDFTLSELLALCDAVGASPAELIVLR